MSLSLSVQKNGRPHRECVIPTPAKRPRLTPKMQALAAAILLVHRRRLPRPPLSVLARRTGYTSRQHVSGAIARLKRAGVLTEDHWEAYGRPSLKLWGEKVR